MTFQKADILLPKFSKNAYEMKKWSVVACDQYTSEPDYWQKVENFVSDSASTLKITVPEIYLNDEDIENRIKTVNKTMEKYMSEELFCEYKDSYIFVERTLANGVKRYGVVGAVDLEDYDFSPDSQTKIRATEGTVISRIPPRLKVRRDASIELPHIMLLIDDIKKDIIESNAKITDSFDCVYDFDLQQNSGHIKGYKMSDEACDALNAKLLALENLDEFNKKYGVTKENMLIFAMGDGNHSLATAKTNYENLKKEAGEDFALKSPARYALCELVNLHDDSLVFEAIHRVIFNADGDEFISRLEEKFDISYNEDAVGQSFTFVKSGDMRRITILNPKEYLTVATIQKELDLFVKNSDAEIDYIHGDDVVCKLCEKETNFGIILDAMDKSDLYKSVILDGALPRKTFSMGEACDKRFYIECRKIK